ncbi:DUF5641 domain-containing protein [Nephila pilipes]|uniref:DUF5641 domain-containing protein n=1 Tax=Nephila pilipes TaxID=299642 RepID=A0A8X6PPF3_NEPPI|nr:DUF5641 domain-containing protein [Nephila pilipes]
MKSFYVDNCVTSVSNEDTLYRFIEESKRIMATTFFDLRGWEHTSLKIGRDPSEPIPVLGLLWNKDENNIFCDTTVFKCQDNFERFDWILHRVIDIYPGKYNQVRVVKVKTKAGEFTQPVKKLYPLELSSFT